MTTALWECRELGVAGWCTGGRGLVLRGLTNAGSYGKGTDQPPNDGRGCRDAGKGDCRSGRSGELR